MYTLLLFSMLFSDNILLISSPAFEQKGLIPVKYTCEGENTSPPLVIGNVPPAAKCLAIIVDDPDATKGTFRHWVAWNIAPDMTIPENTAPGIQGKNGSGKLGYTGPCPPTGNHRYFFKVYALDVMLHLKPDADKKQIEHAIQKHSLAYGELIGTYQKTNGSVKK